MKRKKLFLIVSLILSLFFAGSVSAELVIYDEYIYDCNSGLSWYRNLAAFNGMWYSDQLLAIDELDTAGVNWRMANFDDITQLFEEYSFEDLFLNANNEFVFSPTGLVDPNEPNDLWWLGHFAFYPDTPSLLPQFGPDEAGGVFINGIGEIIYPLTTGGLGEGVSFVGAWAVTSGIFPDSDDDGLGDCQDSCPNEDATGKDADGDGCIDTDEDLPELIIDLGITEPGLESGLLDKANKVQNKIDGGKIRAACNQLDAMINQVNGQRDHFYAEDDADILIEFIENIKTQIGC